MINVEGINLLLGKLDAPGYLAFMFVLVVLLPLVVAMIPIGFFYLISKLIDLIKRREYLLAAMISFAIMLTLAAGVISYMVAPAALLIGGVLGPLSWLICIAICMCIFLILSAHLIIDIASKKELPNFKRVVIGVLIIIYSLPMVPLV